jgi:AcrR family transcriptional regulator
MKQLSITFHNIPPRDPAVKRFCNILDGDFIYWGGEESPALNGFERRTQAKKRKIIDAARSLFFEKGPSRTPVAEIARRAGVSQVSIYNYFESKDALLGIVIREHLGSSLARAEAVLDLEVPFAEKLRRFFALGQDAGSDITDESLKSFDWQDPRIQAIYESFVAERQVPFLMRFVEQGKAEGAIRQDLSNDAVIAYLSANMAIYRDKELLKRGKEYLGSLSHLFFYGLLGR